MPETISLRRTEKNNLPQILEERLLEALDDGTNFQVVAECGGRTITFTRYVGQDECGSLFDNRELHIIIPGKRPFSGIYFQAVRLPLDVESYGCPYERRVDVGDFSYSCGGDLCSPQALWCDGEECLSTHMDAILDPFLGMMQLQVVYVQEHPNCMS